jgi:hypothetical protein
MRVYAQEWGFPQVDFNEKGFQGLSSSVFHSMLYLFSGSFRCFGDCCSGLGYFKPLLNVLRNPLLSSFLGRAAFLLDSFLHL